MLVPMQMPDGQSTDVEVVRVAVIDKASATVSNVIVLPAAWPTDFAWTPDSGFLAVATDVGNVGDSYVAKTKTFVPPAAPDA